MVVNEFNVVGMTVHPTEANSPLVVDPYAVLTGPIAVEFLQAIARRKSQIIEPDGGINMAQFSQHDAAERRRISSYRFARPEARGVPIGKASDHWG